MKEQPILQTERDFYEAHKQDYLRIYKNQFVLIKDKQFSGAFTTEAEAYRAGIEHFGNQPFLIKQVVEQNDIVSFPALTVGAIHIAY